MTVHYTCTFMLFSVSHGIDIKWTETMYCMVPLWYGLLWYGIACNMIQTELKHRSECQLTMMTSSNRKQFRVTGPLCGEFTGHRWIPAHKGQWCGALISYLICALNKQSWDRWFEKPSRSLWRHCNALYIPHHAFTEEWWSPLISKRLTKTRLGWVPTSLVLCGM